ncbi:Type IV pilus biogenesis protein PilN [hydrothermal vent metagenome]|uniref:Type IV pilus biogenesis protein PilN n=1 Tax=hydrothermal vent metagenome TaxID=652676 RepID=A0A3B1B7G6_9ZZZZ
MARINLLPWREELRKEQQRQFLTIMGLSVVLMGLIITVVHIQYANMISTQNQRNQFLTAQIADVDAQIKEIEKLESDKQSLQARISVIQQLQGNRPEIVHLFDEIARILPQGLYLRKIDQKGKAITIVGIAQSNARVSAFMRNIEASDWLDKPVLDIIKLDKKEDDDSREFTLRLMQVNKSAENKS